MDVSQEPVLFRQGQVAAEDLLCLARGTEPSQRVIRADQLVAVAGIVRELPHQLLGEPDGPADECFVFITLALFHEAVCELDVGHDQVAPRLRCERR